MAVGFGGLRCFVSAHQVHFVIPAMALFLLSCNLDGSGGQKSTQRRPVE